MSGQPKPMPPTTFSALVPPKAGYAYFENAGTHPFQPHAAGYPPVNAWWLAEASFLAYEKGADVLKKTGLFDSLKLSPRVFEGPTLGNQCVVAAGEGFAIVAFRGTRVVGFPDPIGLLQRRLINPTDLLTDANFAITPESHVHPGFEASLHEVWNEIKPHLDEIGGSDGGRALWFTGHSLGAALATLAADLYGSDKVRGLSRSARRASGTESSRGAFPSPASASSTTSISSLTCRLAI